MEKKNVRKVIGKFTINAQMNEHAYKYMGNMDKHTPLTSNGRNLVIISQQEVLSGWIVMS